MLENLGKYIQRLSAFGIIVIGAKMTSNGFAVLKTTAVTEKPAEIWPIICGVSAVLLGCLLMAKTYVERQKGNRKKGGRK